jgi:hypothetical protein
MVNYLTLFNFILFLLLSGIHFYWVCEGIWTLNAALPTDANGKFLFSPGFGSTLLVGFGWLLFEMLNLILREWFQIPTINPNLLRYSILTIVIIFLLRSIVDFKYIGFSERLKNSAFARKDDRIYTPLCLLIALTHLLMI